MPEGLAFKQAEQVMPHLDLAVASSTRSDADGRNPDSPDRSGRQARKPRNHRRNRGFLLSPVASAWIRPSDSAQEPEFPTEIGARCPRNDNSSGKSGLKSYVPLARPSFSRSSLAVLSTRCSRRIKRSRSDGSIPSPFSSPLISRKRSISRTVTSEPVRE